MTLDEETAFCEATDRVFDMLLGRNLMMGTLRLAVIAIVVCAIGAAISEFVA